MFISMGELKWNKVTEQVIKTSILGVRFKQLLSYYCWSYRIDLVQFLFFENKDCLITFRKIQKTSLKVHLWSTQDCEIWFSNRLFELTVYLVAYSPGDLGRSIDGELPCQITMANRKHREFDEWSVPESTLDVKVIVIGSIKSSDELH